MERTLDATKTAVSARYVGRAGIHGIGVRRAQNALAVYLHSADEAEQAEVLRQLQSDAAPYRVMTIVEELPVLQ